jgi:hypothetical protein
MTRSIAALAIVLAALKTACSGGSSKTPTPTTVAVATEAQATSTPAAPPTAKPATAAPLTDFCSRVSAADVEALAGPGATALTGDAATAVAAQLGPVDPAGFLAGCDYRSDAAELSASSITLSHYETRRTALLAQEPPGTAQSVSDVGTEATLFILTAPQPFDIDGRAYTGQALLFAKNDTSAISVSIVTAGSPASVDVERLKTLARALLQ